MNVVKISAARAQPPNPPPSGKTSRRYMFSQPPTPPFRENLDLAALRPCSNNMCFYVGGLGVKGMEVFVVIAPREIHMIRTFP